MAVFPSPGSMVPAAIARTAWTSAIWGWLSRSARRLTSGGLPGAVPCWPSALLRRWVLWCAVHGPGSFPAGPVVVFGARGRVAQCVNSVRLTLGVPVVFLLLPITVLFALYPGLVTLVSLTR